MIKWLYKPVDLIADMLGGMLAGLIFKMVWRIIGRGDKAPEPTDVRQGWGEILLAAGLHGAIFALVKAAVDRGTAEVRGAVRIDDHLHTVELHREILGLGTRGEP